MRRKLEVDTVEDKNWDYFIELPDYDRTALQITNVKGSQFLEPLFAVLNFAKINPSPMGVDRWTMEVDWVKHERRLE